MGPVVHLRVEQGESRGKSFSVPPEGARLGRSSKNDFVIVDPALSRHHCRFFFKTDDGLWLTDLGSANQTTVNGQAIQETRLQPGDCIQIGDTVLRVLHDGTHAWTEPPAPATLDLGLRPSDRPVGQPKSPGNRRILLWSAAALVSLLALAAWVPRWLRPPAAHGPAPDRPPPPPDPFSLEILYEKTEADTNNIFRYVFRVQPGNRLAIEIDDLRNNRHVRDREKPVAEGLLQKLAQSLERNGFFSLEPEYRGVASDALRQYEIAVTLGRRFHASRVFNRAEPEEFRLVREMLEEFGRNELGLWAIQFPAEKLRELAAQALLQANKLYAERDVQLGNLHEAIRHYREAGWYLDTLEPKPDFYGEIEAGRTAAVDELDRRFAEASFRVDRAIQLRNWPDAARELRGLLELVPDGADPRHEEARRKLVDVDRRLTTS